MHIYPHSNSPDALGVMVLVIAPAVFLLCWLFNACRLGKFKNFKWSLFTPGNRIFLFFITGICVILLAFIIRSFFAR